MSDQEANWQDWLKALPLYLLPHHALSRGVYRLSRWETRLKDPVARWFIRQYGLNMAEALDPEPAHYASFNALFTRALHPDARPLDTHPDALLSPADSRVSQFGRLRDGRMIQAKGHDYSAQELLGGCPERAAPFMNGNFITQYLSPSDYHRVHMPWDGVLRETVYVPGRLFSVAPFTTRTIPRLFARNERLVCLFDTDMGPLAMVLVGAINVASIETVWSGEVTPRLPRKLEVKDHRSETVSLSRGDEMGRFNLGSTVILLLPEGAVEWSDELTGGRKLKMGEALGWMKPVGMQSNP
ncbi:MULTISPECIES: archaetidylserine decarboxylase [unclassified Ectothiorhodospira]|uniref:archaetidylserine decarboxylase n=1 Tax=unclassified Ectothiorhodospira TaxID=2684909 RepID=UPI001EE834BE|nr:MULTISPECIES: archaetidylserine decarboxylase [unclassified Ectothiorhodospira]MCG5515813.1 archaetidylserine decarboxylase [Ectothiorhodospira sp. 9100]MCG5518899.1 archaetidylserine decarboxylase [Ectothiorhodospira sp. 9905]